jgi:phosphoglycerate dehydrogenase-like enzyme
MAPTRVVLIDPALAGLVPRFVEQLPVDVEVVAVSSFDRAEFARLAADATILVNARRVVDADTLRLAPGVRMIQMIGAGIDPIDRSAAEAASVAVAFNPGVNTIGAAEHTVMLILSLLKGLQASEMQTRAGAFAPGPMIERGIDDLADATVGLVGMGRIAQAVVHRLAPFGPDIVYHSRRPVAEVEERYGARWLRLDELLPVATVLSLHVPLTPATRGLIGAAELGSMPRGAYLINAGRGGLVNEPALRDAIQRGHLAGAAIDVIEHESDGVNPFADLPQVIVTPHLGGASRNSMRNTVDRCTANIRRFIAGEPLADQVT